jgi:uncharacterized membrane protein
MTVRQYDASILPELRALGWAGYLLGFGLGGFFDGILLHQILQWHHLLSLVTRAPFQDIRVQILADGVFHLLMYVVALGGLWKLWKGRHHLGDGDRLLLANAAIGFGAWHMVDGILSHWVLGLRRARLVAAAGRWPAGRQERRGRTGAGRVVWRPGRGAATAGFEHGDGVL